MKKGSGKSRVRAQSKWAESFSKQIINEIWPKERDFFERPDRFKYVRKLLPETSCVFCAAEQAKVGFESLVLVKDKHCMVVMNKYPYNTGHLLVLPRQHLGTLSDLSEPVNARLALWLKASVGILKEVLNCHGFNLGLNQGAVAGAGIPDHLHWHIIPRWGGDTNFFPLIADTKVLPETLEQTYSRLVKAFQAKG